VLRHGRRYRRDWRSSTPCSTRPPTWTSAAGRPVFLSRGYSSAAAGGMPAGRLSLSQRTCEPCFSPPRRCVSRRPNALDAVRPRCSFRMQYQFPPSLRPPFIQPFSPSSTQSSAHIQAVLISIWQRACVYTRSNHKPHMGLETFGKHRISVLISTSRTRITSTRNCLTVKLCEAGRKEIDLEVAAHSS
jgi:hypothetical protein